MTSAALILFLAFASLASAPSTDLKVFATGLGVGHPARRDADPRAARPRARRVARPWNWWFPKPVARLLRVPPTTPEPVRG